MFQEISLFKSAAAMARHAGARQAIAATNIANADTPGYRAQRLPEFSNLYKSSPDSHLRQSRAGHLAPTLNSMANATFETTAEPAPNGNSVSIEEEMLHSINNEREHSRALAIYRHAMTVLRTTISR